MARGKRHVSTFSLSFLDIMACGFGAVTLLFLILKHDAEAMRSAGDTGAATESRRLTEDIREGERNQLQLRNSLKQLEEEITQARGRSRRVLDELEQRQNELSIEASPEQEIALLQEQVTALEAETARLRQQDSGADTRAFFGTGDRQYLTGLKLGGQRVLILVDSSASMLAETIVNVVRRRNMDESSKRASAKWQTAIRTVEWLVAQLPRHSDYQIYSFNTEASALVKNHHGRWLSATDTRSLDDNVRALKNLSPNGGTSLVKAFQAIGSFSLKPDNIFLITDGLPTQGKSRPGKNTVSGKQRLAFFEQAVDILPRGIPVNVILLPMEGDPAAAAAYWQLGISSGGAFLSPARDWP